MTQLAIEPPKGRHPLKSPKLWVDLENDPTYGLTTPQLVGEDKVQKKD